jgi:hypothetical protein
MGVYSWLHRRTWKAAVVNEIHRKHGINIRVIGDEVIGPGRLDDLLNAQYELTAGPPELGAKNVVAVLAESFGIDVATLKTRMELEQKIYGRP